MSPSVHGAAKEERMKIRRTRALVVVLLALAVWPGLAAAAEENGDDNGTRMKSDTFGGLKLRGIGPALMSGRIADIAIHPGDRSTWYVAVGSGGVFKTENAGTTWTPIFDGESSYSIGCVAIDPQRPQVIWVGTGENVSGRHVGYGDGVYKSVDGGKSWKNVGLPESEHIGRILIDPRDGDVVWVAAEGPLWSSGGERGLYKTTDGGKSWTAVLQIDDDTGITDIEFDPRDPETVYAASYQRRRHIWSLLAGGPGSGIHKTVDGGATWTELTNGLPKGDMGKIGIDVSPVDPDYVYATIEASEKERGFYRSTNAGGSWEKRNGYISNGTGPHYYQEIEASPHKRDRVYQMDVWMHVTEDGGKTFNRLGEPQKHSDNHALAFVADDPDYLLAGCDGGLYESFDHAKSWKYVANLPVTQFYKLALDNDSPFYNVAGGTQDNGTQLGPSRTLNVHGIRNRDWTVPLGADGHGCRIDPENPDVLYLEWQRGNLVRVDKQNAEQLHIKPQPAAGDPPERWNWDAPILISPHSSKRLYFGSQRLWRSDDRGDSWRAVSGDLTRDRNRYELEMTGRVWSVDALYDNGAMSWYATLTALSESPRVEGLIWAGSDDGVISVTGDGGRTWNRIDKIKGVPELAYVNDVLASQHADDTVYAALDNHKVGDFKTYLLKSTDRGKSWRSIVGDLPERHIVWSLVEDHVNPSLLFAGTEFGIFFTVDGGEHWIKLSGGVPTISFRDLEIQRRENDLVGASFGRGFYVLDDYSPLRRIDEQALEQEAILFPVRRTWWYLPQNTMAVPGQAYQGGSYYSADNPPHGAVFTYYLKDKFETAKDVRRKAEKKLRKDDKDVPFPGWETLREESLEAKPKVILTVRDTEGAVVRRIDGPAKQGFHRVAWDLHHAPMQPIDVRPATDRPPWASSPRGPLALPGRYRVELAVVEGSAIRPLGEPQEFDVVPLDNFAVPPQDRAAVLAFERRTAELYRKVLGARDEWREADKKVQYLEQAFFETPRAPESILRQIREFDRGLQEVRLELQGDRERSRLNEPSVPSVLDRVRLVVSGHWRTRYGPTGTHRDNLRIAKEGFARVQAQLKRLIETDLPRIEQALEDAGAPWTPGRRLPD
jgi:photosystem II stability/assembly factor-like uncharacterized protein